MNSDPDRLKLVFLNRCYWPDSEATGQLLEDLCDHLKDFFDVHVICGAPNSPVTDDYKRKGIQVHRGVTIHRLGHSQFSKRVPAGRIMNLLSFTRATDRYLKQSMIPADLLISETDPFLLPIIAHRHAQRTGAKLVCYLQDIYPDVAIAIGKAKRGLLTRTIQHKLQRAYRDADRVVVLGRCMRDRLKREPWSIAPSKLSILPNWADCQSITPMSMDNHPFRKQHDLEHRFVVMHSGNMGLTQQLNVLIDATQQDPWPASAVLLLVGDGAAKLDLIDQAKTLKHPDRVRFLPYQPREKLGESLSAGDLHIVSMHPKITGCLCPSKLYGIMAAGRPILAISDPATELAQTVNEHLLGWTCLPGQPVAIAHAVSEATHRDKRYDEAAKNARKVATEMFDRPVVIQQFKELILHTANQPGCNR